jgi:uncharacterized delta-60 repeat protein
MKPSTPPCVAVNAQRQQRSIFASTTALLASILLAHAQPLLLDTTFEPELAELGAVNTLAISPTGHILAGGHFRLLHENLPRHIARLAPDGTADLAFIANTDAPVERIISLNDGRILIRGPFTTLNEQSNPGLARLHPNGTLDPTFNAPVSIPAGAIREILVAGDNGVWVSGQFSHLNGLEIHGVARLLENGAIDPTFVSPFDPSSTLGPILSWADDQLLVAGDFLRVAGHYSPRLVRLNADGSPDVSFESSLGERYQVHSLALQSNGSILINGFDFADSYAPHPSLLRLLPDGHTDVRFTPRFDATPSDKPPPLTMAIQPDERILIAGQFIALNSISRPGLARLHQDGSVDLAFDPGLGTDDGPIHTFLPAPDGRVLIGGQFHLVESFARPLLARLRSESNFDPAALRFAAHQSIVREGASHAYVNVLRDGDPAHAITVDFHVTGGTAIPGEDFQPVNGTLSFAPSQHTGMIAIPIHRGPNAERHKTVELALTRPTNGAQLAEPNRHLLLILHEPTDRSAGQLDPEFRAIVPGPVTALLRLPDGPTLVAGHFAESHSLKTYLRLLDPSGVPAPDFVQTNQFDSGIASLAQTFDGRILVGGWFRHVNGVVRPGLVRLEQDGTVDASFVPFPSWDRPFPTRGPWVLDMLVTAEGRVFCGGAQLTDQFNNPISSWFQLDPDGNRIPNSSPDFPIASRSTVYAFRPLPNSGAIVAGFGFTSRILRIDHTGSIDLHFVTPSRHVQNVAVIETTPDGGVLLQRAGLFPFHSSGPLQWLAPNGRPDPVFQSPVFTIPPEFLSPTLTAIAFDPDSRVLVGGPFLMVDGVSRRGITRIHRDGSLDFSFDPGSGLEPSSFNVPTKPNVILTLPEGGWLIGGDFLGYDGVPQPYLARILSEQPGRPHTFDLHTMTSTFDENLGALPLTITRSGDASVPAKVRLTTASGSGTSGEDFEPLDAIVEFAPNQWHQTVNLIIIDNNLVQLRRSFTVHLETIEGDYAIPDPSLDLTIADDDAHVEFAENSYSTHQSQGFAVVTLRRRASRGDQITVPLHLGHVEVSAVFPAIDLNSVLTTDTIRVLVPIPINDDHEGSRDLLITLGQPSAPATLGPRSSATLTILDYHPTPSPVRGVNGTINAISAGPQRHVYLAGEFTGVHGLSRLRIARLLPNGDVDPAFDPGLGPDGRITALAVQADGRVLMGGDFQRVSGFIRKQIARLLPDGSLDPTFDPGAGPIPLHPAGPLPPIHALVLQPNGRVLVGGLFAAFDRFQRPHLVRLFPNGEVDRNFVTPLHRAEYVEAPPDSIVVQSDGKILIAGLPIFQGAERDTLFRLLPDGDFDPRFTHSTPNWFATAVASLGNGQLLVAYRYPGSNHDDPSNNPPDHWLSIRRLHPDGSPDPGFHVHDQPPLGSNGAHIRQLLTQPDGRILCRVELLDRRGADDLRHSLVVRLMPDGAWDSSFVPVEAVPATLLLAEQFHANSLEPPPLLEQLSQNGAIRGVVLDPSGTLTVGGAFLHLNTKPRRSLARLDLDGYLRGMPRLKLIGDETPGQLRLTVSPEVEAPYHIQWSPDLGTWHHLIENHDPWTGLELLHHPGGGSITGFYRAVRAD